MTTILRKGSEDGERFYILRKLKNKYFISNFTAQRTGDLVDALFSPLIEFPDYVRAKKYFDLLK